MNRDSKYDKLEFLSVEEIEVPIFDHVRSISWLFRYSFNL